jgi:hypothetical protein
MVMAWRPLAAIEPDSPWTYFALSRSDQQRSGTIFFDVFTRGTAPNFLAEVCFGVNLPTEFRICEKLVCIMVSVFPG